jgi:hypothetical protein
LKATSKERSDDGKRGTSDGLYEGGGSKGVEAFGGLGEVGEGSKELGDERLDVFVVNNCVGSNLEEVVSSNLNVLLGVAEKVNDNRHDVGEGTAHVFGALVAEGFEGLATGNLGLPGHLGDKGLECVGDKHTDGIGLLGKGADEGVEGDLGGFLYTVACLDGLGRAKVLEGREKKGKDLGQAEELDGGPIVLIRNFGRALGGAKKGGDKETSLENFACLGLLGEGNGERLEELLRVRGKDVPDSSNVGRRSSTFASDELGDNASGVSERHGRHGVGGSGTCRCL